MNELILSAICLAMFLKLVLIIIRFNDFMKKGK